MLPWFKLPIVEGDNYNNILESKINIKSEELWIGLPKSFIKIYEYIRELHINEEINYDFIENLLHSAAREWKISLPNDPKLHRFHWLLEGKRETDGSHFQRTMKHLQSLDSFLDKNKSNEYIDDETFKTFAKESKEEWKGSPNGTKNCLKSKKKVKKVSKWRKLKINQLKNFASQQNSFTTRNPLRLASPSHLCPRVNEQQHQLKMDEMLNLNVKENTDSYQSDISRKNHLEVSQK